MAYVGLKNEELQEFDESEVDYDLGSPNKFFSTHANLVPMQNAVQGPRVFYGAKFNNQALPVINREAPLVQALIDGNLEERSFDEDIGKHAGARFSPAKGRVSKVGTDDITIEDAEGNKHIVELYNNFPFNRKTAIHNTPVVSIGDQVIANQVVAKSNYTDDKGTLALGLNAHVGVVPYKGFSFDDSIVISESFAKKLSSDHMDVFNMAYKKGVKGGKGHHVSIFSAQRGTNYYTNDQLEKLDADGVVKEGTIIENGDPIILATKPKAISSSSAMLGKLSNYMKSSRNDASETWETEVPGMVTDVVKTSSGVKVMIKSVKPVVVGDKLTFRAGQKNVVSKIVDDDHMLRTADGKPLDVLLNPLAIPSRINNSMIYEILLGKAAKAAGKTYKLPTFNGKDETWFDYVANQLAEHNLSETDVVFDPQLNVKLENPITTGYAYMLKLHHTATSKASARAQGAYDNNEQPLKGGSDEAKSKRLSNLQDHALLSSGAYAALKDMSLLRGARNDDYWQRLREGYDPKTPDTPFVWNKFLALLTGAGYQARKIGNTGNLRLGPMTDKSLDELDPGDLKNGELVELSTLEPVKGGLFDNVLVATNKYGRIKLPFPIPNPAFEEPIRRILGLTEKQFRDILSGKAELPEHLQKRLQGLKKEASAVSDISPVNSSMTGPEAIAAAVDTFTVEDLENEAVKLLQAGTKTKRPLAVRLLRYVKGFRRNKLNPSDYVIRNVPVIPPKFRPFSVVGDSFVPGAANELYRDLFSVLKSHNDVEKVLGRGAANEHKLNVYDSVKAVYGFGEPVLPKTKQRGVAGFLKQITGNTAKFSFFQRKLISKPVDMTARAVIGVDPDLDLDQIGIPKDAAFTVYSPYVQRRLVRNGMPRTEAIKAVMEKTPAALKVLENIIKTRPLIYSREPAWHKYSVIAGYPKLIDGKTFMISPLVTTGLNADFDGDTINIHVPGLPDAVKDAKEKLLPSKMLFSMREHDRVVPTPNQELILGLYTAQKRPAKNNYVFSSEEEALTAIENKQVKLSDNIEIK